MGDWFEQFMRDKLNRLPQHELTHEEKRVLAESNRVADLIAQSYYYDLDCRANNTMRRCGE